MHDVGFSSDPEDILFFPSLLEAMALLNYLQAVCKYDMVQLFVVAELEV